MGPCRVTTDTRDQKTAKNKARPPIGNTRRSKDQTVTGYGQRENAAKKSELYIFHHR